MMTLFQGITIYIIILVAEVTVVVKGNPTVDEKGNMFEGDISMSKGEQKEMKMEMRHFGTIENSHTWPRGIIPYEISPEFTPRQKNELREALNEISESTCIRFKPRYQEKDYVVIILADKCSSKVGKSGGRQIIKMKPTCMRHGTIVHELMHTLGFWHEQSRLDRDEYITIKWDNINPKSKINFQTYTSKSSHDFDIPYDYGSIMHYSGEAFQKRRGLETIVPKTKHAPIGLRKSMSHFDKLKINLMYSCSEYL